MYSGQFYFELRNQADFCLHLLWFSVVLYNFRYVRRTRTIRNELFPYAALEDDSQSDKHDLRSPPFTVFCSVSTFFLKLGKNNVHLDQAMFTSCILSRTMSGSSRAEFVHPLLALNYFQHNIDLWYMFVEHQTNISDFFKFLIWFKVWRLWTFLKM